MVDLSTKILREEMKIDLDELDYYSEKVKKHYDKIIKNQQYSEKKWIKDSKYIFRDIKIFLSKYKKIKNTSKYEEDETNYMKKSIQNKIIELQITLDYIEKIEQKTKQYIIEYDQIEQEEKENVHDFQDIIFEERRKELKYLKFLLTIYNYQEEIDEEKRKEEIEIEEIKQQMLNKNGTEIFTNRDRIKRIIIFAGTTLGILIILFVFVGLLYDNYIYT